jgi:hypothetical protein
MFISNAKTAAQYVTSSSSLARTEIESEVKKMPSEYTNEWAVCICSSEHYIAHLLLARYSANTCRDGGFSTTSAVE